MIIHQVKHCQVQIFSVIYKNISFILKLKHGSSADIGTKVAYKLFDNSPACPSLGATETGVSLPSLPVPMALVRFAR